MDSNLITAGERKIRFTIANLAKRNMKGHYFETKDDALDFLFSEITKLQKESGSDFSVSWGGSVTLGELGIKDLLKEHNIKTIEPFEGTPEEAYKNKLAALGSNVFMMSTNAITMNGELVNVDGTGNRMAAFIFGPKKVFVIAGINKLVATLEEAESRIKTDACPPNAIRLSKQVPCALTGKCTNCLIDGQTSCANTVITRFCSTKNRIEVILVNENMGY